MKLVASKPGQCGRLDRLALVRPDRSRPEIDIPREGVLPHDLLHFVVEQGLGRCGGFLALQANGAESRDIVPRPTPGPVTGQRLFDRAVALNRQWSGVAPQATLGPQFATQAQGD